MYKQIPNGFNKKEQPIVNKLLDEYLENVSVGDIL